MNKLPYTLYKAADVRELDRIAIEQYGIAGIELMNRAGAALFSELCCRWPDARNIVVICGGGNNGGDGFVVARLAHEKDFNVSLIVVSDVDAIKGDAKTAWGASHSSGLVVQDFTPEVLNGADLVIDAIFGTGLDRAIEGHLAEVVNLINNSDVPVLAADIPSGLHADSGRILGTAIHAAATVSFIGLKQGVFTGQGPDCAGVVTYDDLGVPEEAFDRVPVSAERIDWLAMKSCLPKRARTAHKGTYGHVLVVGGNNGMAGAVRLAAEAAARVGSGLISVVTRPEHVAAMAAARPEIMWRGVTSAAGLREAMQRATVIAIGPGLGQDDWAIMMLNTVLESSLPLVIDADALNLLAIEPSHRGQWILTPHPAEAARLLGCDTTVINDDRFAAVRQLRSRYSGNVLLKGAGTLIADENGTVALCNDGNPGMATGGMGDVLTGVIAGLLAQGLSFAEAIKAGVCLHAAAGDKASLKGERGMMASDVVAALRSLVN